MPGSVANSASGSDIGAAADSSSGVGSSARPAVDVTAVTARDDFLLELGPALGGQASVRPVESVAAAVETLASTKRAQILVIDARDVAELGAEVTNAHAHARHAVVLVFATAEEEKQVAASLKGSNVFAVLPIPIDARKTGAVMEGAIADATARRAAAAVSAAPPVTTPLDAFRPQLADAPAAGTERTDTSHPDAARPRSRLPLLAGGAAALAALVAIGFFVFKTKEPSTPTARATPAAAKQDAAAPGEAALPAAPLVEQSIVQGKVDELLEKARLAMRERRYTDPNGDNALLFYRSAAAADPNNGEAQDGLQRVAGVLLARFEDALGGSRLDEAAVALANFKLAAPGDARHTALEQRLLSAQIARALADGNFDRAAALLRQTQQLGGFPADQLAKWRNEIARRQDDTKLQRLVGLVAERIRDGKLVDPEGDSAKTYVAQLREAAPTNLNTQRAVRDLNGAYLRKAREATLAKNAPESERWVQEARAGGASATDIAAVQKDLNTVRQKLAQSDAERFAQLTRERIADARLTDPSQDSAAWYLGQLQTTDAGNPAIPTLSRDLAAKLLDRARASVQAGNIAQSEADLAQARRFGADAKEIQAVQQAAASRSAVLNVAALAANLKRTRYVPPEYPPKALAKSQSGVVTVQFTVDGNGEPRDVKVVEATPSGVFDYSAVAAVKHWRYQPVIVNGQAVEIPVRMTVRFELPKN